MKLRSSTVAGELRARDVPVAEREQLANTIVHVSQTHAPLLSTPHL